MTITISLLDSKLKVLYDTGKTTYASIKMKDTIFGKNITDSTSYLNLLWKVLSYQIEKAHSGETQPTEVDALRVSIKRPPLYSPSS